MYPASKRNDAATLETAKETRPANIPISVPCKLRVTRFRWIPHDRLETSFTHEDRRPSRFMTQETETDETTTRISNRHNRHTISTITLKCGWGRPLFQWGTLTQTHPSKCLLEPGAPRIDGNPHTLLPLRYENATTKHAPRQEVRILRNDVIARHYHRHRLRKHEIPRTPTGQR